ncbi:hypothetical protein AVEN_103884-1 [Araneus ventricosus]|uniref:Uncharacterized protein n=1 Tax=Araneus ventricosus TaxID=182803 RepID=A0A4Y2UVP8_ARAVE|nr:hypothetical protein AVEN_103884-1 [Araneus ventricosus]
MAYIKLSRWTIFAAFSAKTKAKWDIEIKDSSFRMWLSRFYKATDESCQITEKLQSNDAHAANTSRLAPIDEQSERKKKQFSNRFGVISNETNDGRNFDICISDCSSKQNK